MPNLRVNHAAGMMLVGAGIVSLFNEHFSDFTGWICCLRGALFCGFGSMRGRTGGQAGGQGFGG